MLLSTNGEVLDVGVVQHHLVEILHVLGNGFDQGRAIDP